MATLAGNTIASTYPLLLKIDSSGIDGTLRAVEDGDGTDSALSIATDSVLVKGDGVKLYFYDADGGEHISANTGGVLSIAGASEIDLTATAIDINGTVDMSSTVQVGGALTVGADDLGHDVIFYGDTASSNMTWDTSGDDLILNNALLKIDSDSAGNALYIDSEASTGIAVQYDLDALSTGVGLGVYSNSSHTGTREIVFIHNDHASATGATALKLTQDAAAHAMYIDQNANDYALEIASDNTTGTAFEVGCNSLTTGTISHFYSASSDTNTRTLLKITNDHASATGATCLHIDQDANQKAFTIDSEATTNHVIRIHTPATTSGAVILLDDVDALTTGNMILAHSNSSDTGSRELVRIHNDHTSATNAIVLNLKQDADTTALYTTASHSTHAGHIQYISASGRSANSGFNFLTTFTGGDSDTQHRLRGDGATIADAAYDGSGADYAEYFESKDGKVIAVGTTVKLDGDKIVACEDGDTPIGVVRPYGNSVVIGNSAPLKWSEKYLTDDYGSPVKEEYSVTEWMEDTDEVKTEAVEAKDAVLYEEGDEIPDGKKVGDEKEAAIEAKAVVYEHKDVQYWTDQIPSDVTVPSNATVTSTEKDGNKLMRKKLNPDYDESKTYTPREERDEWCLIGLLGQIPITKGQPVADNWIKMKDVSNSVEMYFVK